jgi:transposase InsO family protein
MFSYINVSGTFYYLCSVLDGYSRKIVHWELKESMTEGEIEIICKGPERLPGSKTAHHLRQRAAVFGQGFQGVHSHRGHDACEDLSSTSRFIARRPTDGGVRSTDSPAAPIEPLRKKEPAFATQL